jgi:hypothetical protein
MPYTMERPEIMQGELSLLGVMTDYRSLCAPHVPSVREVLTGGTYRHKLRFNDAVFVFYHGCLMSRVVYRGQIFALPPFGLNRSGQPYLTALPEHQRPWLDEFLSLPKDVLLFYFTLLKEVFKGHVLTCQWENPATNAIEPRPIPEELQPILREVDWVFGKS